MKCITGALSLMVLVGSSIMAAEPPRVYIEASSTVDASNSRDEAQQVDFGAALAAALLKKAVPVSIVTDKTKAQWTIKSASAQREDSTGTKAAKLAFGGVFIGGFYQLKCNIQGI